jgi:RHS repeat-associated protein
VVHGNGSCAETAGNRRGISEERPLLLLPNDLLDESKTVVATRLYNAFGETVSETGTWPDEVPFGYQSNWLALDGMTLPDGTRLYLSPTRIYHPGVGRFLQRDPVGSAAGTNLYVYARSEPTERQDPSGLMTACFGASGFMGDLIGFYGGLYFCLDSCRNVGFRITLGGPIAVGGAFSTEFRFNFNPKTTLYDISGWFFDIEVALGPIGGGGVSIGITPEGDRSGTIEGAWNPPLSGIGAGLAGGFSFTHIEPLNTWKRTCCPCNPPLRGPEPHLLIAALRGILEDATDVGFWEALWYPVEQVIRTRANVALMRAKVEAMRLKNRFECGYETDPDKCPT